MPSRLSTLAALLIALGVLAFAATYRTGVASGADPYGYVSQADLWLNGSLRIEQPFARQLPWPDAGKTATPIAYRPAANDEVGTMVPWYSPGLAMLMAVAKAVGGYAAIFWVVPLLTALLVVATYGIGRHFGGLTIGLASAFLCALSPVVLYMSLFPMTDVPVAAVWACATWAVLGTSRRRALAGGLLASVAILIRPNLVFVGMAMGLWLILRDMKRGGPWWRADRAAVFAAASVPGVVAIMALNWYLNSSPFVSGYGTLGSVLHVWNVPVNIDRYASWLQLSQTPVIWLGMLAMVLPIRQVWHTRARAMDATLLLFVALGTLACYLMFAPLEEWWYLRFLMPMWPGLFIGLTWMLFWRGGVRRVVVAALVVLALGYYGYDFVKQRRITATSEGERRFVSAAQFVREYTEPNSVILSYVHSGSIRYYGERMTLRYDQMDPDWLDRSVAWLSAHGAHPYLLVEDWELPQWKDRFADASPLGRMNMSVVFELKWPTRVWLFDLTKPATTTWPQIIGYDRPPVARTAMPAPPPQFILR